MSNLFWLSEEQFKKIKPLLPNDVRGVPRVDDRRVLSGIIHVLKRGLHWSDGPPEYGPAKQFIIARRGGPKKACSPTSSRHWWPRPERRTASPSTARLARLIGAPEAGVKRGALIAA